MPPFKYINTLYIFYIFIYSTEQNKFNVYTMMTFTQGFAFLGLLLDIDCILT